MATATSPWSSASPPNEASPPEVRVTGEAHLPAAFVESESHPARRASAEVESTQTARLRPLVEAMDRELEDVVRQLQDGEPLEAGRAGRLRALWAELVSALALGPEPETRQCPVCGHHGMLAATRCAYCWTALASPT